MPCKKCGRGFTNCADAYYSQRIANCGCGNNSNCGCGCNNNSNCESDCECTEVGFVPTCGCTEIPKPNCNCGCKCAYKCAEEIEEIAEECHCGGFDCFEENRQEIVICCDCNGKCCKYKKCDRNKFWPEFAHPCWLCCKDLFTKC